VSDRPTRARIDEGASHAERPTADGTLPAPAPASPWKLLSPPVIGWILYDFANTIFSYAVITRYFNDWIIVERGSPDWYVTIGGFVVAAALIFSLPFFGALADRIGRRKPFLVGFTLLCVAMTALLGFVASTLLALIVAGVAVYGFNSALAHYDPLLARVAPERMRPRVSGIGVASGYLGVMLTLVILGALVADGENQQAFLPTAVLFLAFALPCFFLVRESPRPAVGGPLGPRAILGQLVTSLRAARGHAYGRFLLARFFYFDALATVIAFMTVYAKRTGGFSNGQVDRLLAIAIVFSVIGALVAGLLAERLGPKRVLIATIVMVAATLVATGVSGAPALLWVVGPMVGIGLGAAGATDRIFLMRLVPEARRGEPFGLYALVGKVSSGVGPFFLWGGTIFVLGTVLDLMGPAQASRVALCMLAAAALAGVLLLRPISDAALAENPDAERSGAPARA